MWVHTVYLCEINSLSMWDKNQHLPTQKFKSTLIPYMPPPPPSLSHPLIFLLFITLLLHFLLQCWGSVSFKLYFYYIKFLTRSPKTFSIQIYIYYIYAHIYYEKFSMSISMKSGGGEKKCKGFWKILKLLGWFWRI